MLKTATIDLRERIIASLTDTNSCLWFPHFTDDLVETGLRELEKDTEITVSDYGTERVTLKDAKAPRDIIISLPIYNNSETSKANIQIEDLSRNTIQQYENSGVIFYNRDEIISSEVLNCLSYAFQIIGKVPSLFTTVVSLVKSLHIIKTVSDEYDVSFSEPNIPFSIFVSIPQKNNEINVLRVAEAITHEAMHLQLTLIESVIPLVVHTNNQYYSPWRDEHRRADGILHALYVFRVIECFFLELLNQNLFSSEGRKHVVDRVNEIIVQIDATKDFSNCLELTESGKGFVRTLLLNDQPFIA